MAAITGAVAVAGATAYSANRQSKAAKSAANKQAKGVENAQDIQREFTGKAVDQLGTQYDAARQALLSGQNQSGRLLDQSGNIISGGYDQARGEINQGFTNADNLLTEGYGDAIGTLDPTYQQGLQSSQLQAALSGALGPEAQQRAYDNYTESPGQEYLRNQQEQSILRNATALGGGLGAQPAVMQALQENAFGLAQSDFNNSYARLSEISGRGDAAANSIANLQASLGGNRAGIQQSLAQILAGMSTGEAGSLAGINTDKANMAANTQQQIAQLLANQGNAVSNAYMQSGSEQTQLAQNLGQANSAYDVYRSQNMDPWAQGLIAGAGAYSGMGGGTGGMFGGGGGGNKASDYTGTAFQKWLAEQRS